MTSPKLVAHRGLPKKYPENTLIGYEAAITAGAKYLETDIQLTQDEVPVLFHDKNLRRLCNAEGAIQLHTLSELAEFYAMDFDQFGYKFSQTPIPILDDFVNLLQQHPDVKAFIEIKRISIKHFSIAQVVAPILRALKPVTRQCIIISYSIPVLQAVKNYGYPTIGAVTDHWRERNNAKINDLNPEYLFCNIDNLPKWGKISLPNRKLVIFSADDIATANTLTKRGANFIETNTIDDMLREMNNSAKNI